MTDEVLEAATIASQSHILVRDLQVFSYKAWLDFQPVTNTFAFTGIHSLEIPGSKVLWVLLNPSLTRSLELCP